MPVVILMSSFNSKTNKEIKTDIIIWIAIITASMRRITITMAQMQHTSIDSEIAMGEDDNRK